ncbi:hypothetical protein K402DRAFT_339953 [Aulographum hederae CBS 113979]|uniref:R3H-associated N-terminal domain-containing protein n=1 Tax=Aulographum hederae CBS 113979 TaxID=1176131 RepID=A0A6G1GPF0_9PEZI|nr:hypothetical protein K402DRAFT_339953 [Aulographum hederae CBS 113979]
MAIHPSHPASSSGSQRTTLTPSEIEAWTTQAVQALNAVSLNEAAPLRGASVTLDIPLDATSQPARDDEDKLDGAAVPMPRTPRREPMRRDSLKRREALLKGKEGSRRRQRWENDRLLSNPWAQAPLPSDWEVQPTCPRYAVPFFLAPIWDDTLAKRVEKREKAAVAAKQARDKVEAAVEGRVPRELRDKLKRAKGAKGAKALLQDLEMEVRKFVARWEEKEAEMVREGMVDPDSEDEEIVFVGRNGQMHDMQTPRTSEESDIGQAQLVFDSLEEDRGASFGRWLVHSIGEYYGLRTWSVTVPGDPARREAYVGLQPSKQKSKRRVSFRSPLPRPLWGLV